MVFDTHSVDLSFDPVEIASLKTDSSPEIKPVEWDGAAPGGHHRKGTLIFRSIPVETASLVLTLRDVAGVPERIFVWNPAGE